MQIPHGSGWSGDRDNYDVAKGPRNHAHSAYGSRTIVLIDRDVKHGPVREIDPSTIDLSELTK